MSWYGNMSDATMNKLKMYIVSRPGYTQFHFTEIDDLDIEHFEANRSELAYFDEETIVIFTHPRQITKGAKKGEWTRKKASIYIYDIIELMNFIAEN